MQTRRIESFLLRIVISEDQSQSPEQWRGRIQHVSSGVEQQIDQLADAIAFITAHLAETAEASIEVEEIVSD
jgi:hypothetical protein